jgi:YD repeat-containing protein
MHCESSRASSVGHSVTAIEARGRTRHWLRRVVLMASCLALPALAAAAPVISSLTPTSGAVGASVTIAGSGFGSTQGTSTVKFNATTATVTSWSATSIVATVPSGATTGSVVVRVSNVNSNGVTFTVVAAPSITSLSPTSGAVSASVTITGTNFGATQGSSTVKFNGTTATVTSWSATSIVTTVPSGATTGTVVVRAAGVNSNGVTFTVVPAPSITSLSPTSGPVATSVTITGTNFGATQGSSTVKFNGTTATPTSWSATSIVAPVPSGATTGTVVVRAAGVNSNGVTFTVVPTPTISTLSPTSGAVGASVTITGTNFGATQGTSTVKFNGTTATPTSWSATSIVAPVPSGATTGNVVVTVNAVPSNGKPFTVVGPPTITPPLSPSAGGILTQVVITGTNFGATQGTSTVKFTATTAGIFSWSATSITAQVPSSLPLGDASVTVTVASQTSNAVTYTVLPTPSVSSVSPNPAPIGAVVTMTGTKFGASQGTSTVSFNGTLATQINSWSDTQIQAVVPAGASTGTIVVTVNGVQSLSATSLRVRPTLFSLNPTTGRITDVITITGNAFQATQGFGEKVTFNGTLATPTSWSDTSITVPVPAGATTGNVVVQVFNSTNLSNPLPFTVIPPPALTAVTPPAAHVNDPVTIVGTNFGAVQGTSTITFNGVTATPTSWSDTQIVTAVPSAATTGNVIVTVASQPSNGKPFTVIFPGSITGTITRATGGTAVAGASVQAILTGVVKGSTTSAANGTYSIASLDPASYEVRVTATGFSPEVGSTAVANGGTSTVNVALSQPGSVSGTVTAATGGTPIAGAAVTIYLGPMPKASTSTNGSGSYAVTNLHPGAYTVQAADVGFRTKETGATISENANTTSNLALDPAGTAPVQYVYDELNRLVSVIDPSGDAAHYNYDAVGNILSIARSGSNTVSISEFTPNSGPVGSSVTINGTGFSTATANTVTFGAAQTTAVATTANKLTVTVPATASGQVPIGISNTLGSATSAALFTLTAAASGGPPTITGFSPAVWDGTSALTINGTNFDATPANDRINLNVAFAAASAATTSTLTVAVPSAAASGRISVATVAGTVTSANDFYIPPPGYAAASLQSTGRVTVGGSQTISLNGNTFAMRLFDAVPGHRVSAYFTNVTLSGSAAMYDPYGRLVHSTGLNWPFVPFLDAVTAVPGTYTLLVSASGAGDATFTLYDIVDKTGTITPDGSVKTATIDIPGQNALYTFSTTQAGRYSLVAGGNSIGGSVSIGDVRGQQLGSTSIGIFSNLLEPIALPAGSYTVGVDYGGAATGDEAIALYAVPDDVTGTLTPTVAGASTMADLTVPGRNAIYTLGMPVNSRVALLVGAGPLGSVSVLNGGTTVTGGSITVVATFIEPWAFAGGQTIKVDPNGSSTGNVTLVAYDVPPDSTGTVTIGGAGVNVPLSAGQNGTLTFTPSSNQSVTVHVTSNNMGVTTVSLLDSGGQTLASGTSLFGGFDLSSANVAAGSTYTVRVDPSGAGSGSLTISISNP